MASPTSWTYEFDHQQSGKMNSWRSPSPQTHNPYKQQSPSVAPAEDQQLVWDQSHSHPHSYPHSYSAHQRAHSSVSQFPPILPPIPRVASQLDPQTRLTRHTLTHVQVQEQGQGQGQCLAEEKTEKTEKTEKMEKMEKMMGRLSFDQSSQSQLLPTSATTASLSPVQSSPSPSSDITSASHPPRLTRRSITSPDGTYLKASSPNESASPNSANSATLGVPYASTMAREKPRSGNRPLAATTSVNGVPQHSSKPEPKRSDPPPPSKSRTRLNLLNPVNLLMRRRSSQAVDTLSDKASSSKSLIVPPMDLPDDYDPRIKGNKVHDFSAPKPRRNLSYNDAVGSPPTLDVTFSHHGTHLDPIQQSPPGPSRQESDEWAQHRRGSSHHSPVFVENFDTSSIDDDRRSSAINAESLANSSFLARNSWQNEKSPSLPPFGRRSQQLDEQQFHAALGRPNPNRSSDPVSVSSETTHSEIAHGLGFRFSDESCKSLDTAPTVTSRPVSKEMQLPSESPSLLSVPPSSPPMRNLSPDDSPYLAERQLPSIDQGSSRRSSRRSSALRHLPSSASRFSFQIASMDSLAEEKLLEDKHKQRHSAQQNDPLNLTDSDMEEDEDEFFDEDAMYDHDEMEGFDEPEILGGNNVFQNTHNLTNPVAPDFSDMANDLPKTPSPPSSPQPHHTSFPTTSGHHTETNAEPRGPLGQYQRSPPFQLASDEMPAKPASPMSPNSFYFDDGMIDSLDHDNDANLHDGPRDKDGNVFDEDQFDNPSFLRRPNAPQHLFGEDQLDNPGLLDKNPAPQQVFDEDQFDDPDFLRNPQASPQALTEPHFDKPSILQRIQAPQHEREPSRESNTSHHNPGKSSNRNTYSVNGLDFVMHDSRYPTIGRVASDSPYSEEGDRTVAEPLRHDSPSQYGRSSFEAQNSLSAYHSALAEAAQKAAAEGRFDRHASNATSMSMRSDGERSESPEILDAQVNPVNAPFASASRHEFRPSLSAFDFEFQAHQNPMMNDMFPSTEVPSDEFGYHFPQHEDDDDYDFDDADLIAEANADALSADDSGLYSQEFGFYAKPRPGSAEGEADINGGYFGQPGIEFHRQKSLREPNLTPITERSEFSTRNSIIAGPGGVARPWSPMSYPGSVQGLPSPALSTSMLAQQRGISPTARLAAPQEDENMTLADIRRSMHAHTYAGSNGSIMSDFGPSMSSPSGEHFGAGRPYSPAGHPNQPGSAGIPGAGFFMPMPRSNPIQPSMGGVPMTWQRSTDSNNSQPRSQPSNYSSSPVMPSSPNFVTEARLSPIPQGNEAQAFSFFDAGGDDNNGVDNIDRSNAATPRKPTSTTPHARGPSSPPPDLPSFPQTPATARKAPPAAIILPSYSSGAKAALGSPLKMGAFPPAPRFSESPVFAHSAHSGNENGNGKAYTHSPVQSPKGYPGHKRMSSGADSVTYVQEKDAAGARRWVLERRRTSEQGFLELIGREIVEGGRI